MPSEALGAWLRAREAAGSQARPRALVRGCGSIGEAAVQQRQKSGEIGARRRGVQVLREVL